jgi:hypothetical protein
MAKNSSQKLLSGLPLSDPEEESPVPVELLGCDPMDEEPPVLWILLTLKT